MIAAVIGSPIAHSLSPKLFSFMAESEGVELDYQAIEVALLDSKNFLEQLKVNKNFLGLNVTVPLKEAFLSDIDVCSPEVKIIGALNVLHLKNDKIYGHNTDVIGIERTLKEKKFYVDDKTCLILGAGGGARAQAYVLGMEKAKCVYVYNLSDKNSELIKNFKLHFPETSWIAVNPKNGESLKDVVFDLIVNTTPLGMTGKDSGADFFTIIDTLKFKKEALAFDLIYTPAETIFLRKCKELHQLSTVGGLGMLIYQALGTWSIWQGELSNEAQMKADLAFFLSGILKLKKSKYALCLTGFMGAGKSQVGGHLAKLLDAQFIDSDDYIEKKMNEKIVDIFKNSGEDTFRLKESECLKEIMTQDLDKTLVISLGGGSLIDSNNLNLVLKEKSLLIYLKASLETINQRIKNHEIKTQTIRPMLSGLDDSKRLSKMKELFFIREPSYKSALISVETECLSALQVAFEVIKSIGKNPKVGEISS